MLHSMTISLIHVDHLETLYLCYGVKCQSGVIWGQRLCPDLLTDLVGITFAIFSFSGTIPVDKERLNILVSGLTISL